MALLSFTVVGLDKTVHYLSGSLRFSWRLGARGTFNFSFRSQIPELDVPLYRPDIGQQVGVFLGGVRFLTGSIQEIETTRLAPRWSAGEMSTDPPLRLDIRCQTLEAFFDRHMIKARVYEETTAGAIAQDLVETYLDGDQINIGTIEAGATINKLVYGLEGPVSVGKAIDTLAEQSNYYWFVDAENNFHFRQKMAETAPFMLTDETASTHYRGLSVRTTSEDYRNYEYARVNWAAFDPEIETFTGDGSTKDFTLSKRAARIDSVVKTPVSAGPDEPQTVGVKEAAINDDGTLGDIQMADTIWHWAPGSTFFDMHPDETAMAAGDVLTVSYRPLGGDVIEYASESAQSDRAASEGTSGRYEHYVDDVKNVNAYDALGKITKLVDNYAVIPNDLKFETDVDGLRPGQLITVNVTDLGLSGDFLIDEVSGSDVPCTFVDGNPNNIIRYSIGAIDSSKLPGWLEYFRGLAEGNGAQNLTTGVGLAAGSGGTKRSATCIGWDLQDSTPGTDVSDPVIPPADMRIASCRVRIKVTDATNDLEFDILRDGNSIFSTRPVIAAGTSTRDVQVFTTISTVSLEKDADLTLDIITGGTWQVSIYLMAQTPPADGDSTGVESPLTTKGDVWVYSTIDDRLPVGTDGQVLTADSAETTGLRWADATSGSGTVTHTGGALTANMPVFGAGTDDVTVGTRSGNTTEVATVSGSLTAGHFLTVDGSGNVVDGGSAPGGTGTVTSVALSMPAEFSVSGSPVTGSGTITVSKANESANTVFAGPTTGSAAAPTFRALVAADIPAIAESGVTNLTADLAAKAPLASPTFTGAPAAPTATGGTNTTQIATTAFVHTAVAGILPIAESDVTNLTTDLAAKAPLASPTLTGTPAAPTAAAGTSTTQIATTAFVQQEVGVSGSGAYFAWGGDGSDGAATFDGSTTVLGLAPSSSTYALTRDIFCTNITVNSGVTVKAANFAIFATGTCTINGTVHNDGQAGNSGSAAVSATGAAGGTGGIRTSNPGGNNGHYSLLIATTGGTTGGNGGTAAGSQAGAANAGTGITGTPVDHLGSAGSAGSSGGKGGTGTSGAGGAARTGGTAGAAFASANFQVARNAAFAVTGKSYTGASVQTVQASNAGNGGAAGGSGGGGDTTNSGGGGGGGGGEGGSGGVLAIFAHTVTIGAAGIVRSNGGTGGNGGNGRTPTTGNCGGGGGGAGGSGGVGGIVWLVYHRLTNSGTVQASGGSGGTGGTKGSPSGTGTNDAANGADGPTGPAGSVIYIPC